MGSSASVCMSFGGRMPVAIAVRYPPLMPSKAQNIRAWPLPQTFSATVSPRVTATAIQCRHPTGWVAPIANMFRKPTTAAVVPTKKMTSPPISGGNNGRMRRRNGDNTDLDHAGKDCHPTHQRQPSELRSCERRPQVDRSKSRRAEKSAADSWPCLKQRGDTQRQHGQTEYIGGQIGRHADFFDNEQRKEKKDGK